MRIAIYDIETYPNYWLLVAKLVDETNFYAFEISERRNDTQALVRFVQTFQRMVGFNNETFDYVLLHNLYHAVLSGHADKIGPLGITRWLNNLANEIIEEDRRNFIWDRHRIVPQIDLFKIHHLDNPQRRTSLKALEIAMRSPSVVDLPIAPGTWLTSEQMDITAAYCCVDVRETERLYLRSQVEIQFREGLGRHTLCLSDASIGKQTMRRALEKAEPGCTTKATKRDFVNLAGVILPYIQFRQAAFQEILDQFRSLRIPAGQIREALPNLQKHHQGLTYSFGAGGLHACIRPERRGRKLVYMEETAELEIRDIDVISYYPMLAIVNRLAPAHLGETFHTEYYKLFLQRRQYTKGSPENKMLKLALNSVFGDSGAKTSRGFEDVAFMLAITINGQLLTSMLAEALTEIAGLQVLQANTDGLTVIYPRRQRAQVDAVKQWWERGTALSLEEVYFRRIWLRDVNAYLVERCDGKIKRAGPYEYDRDWWQDPSMLAVPKTLEAHLIRGVPIDEALRQQESWDFLIRGRARGKDVLYWAGQKTQKNLRYYVTDGAIGAPLVKWAPPLAGKTKDRETRFHGGRPVMLRNQHDGSALPHVDYGWYAGEVQKLL